MSLQTATTVAGILATTVAFTASPARAHHSFAAEFDANQVIQLEGVITRFQRVRPHARTFMDVTDENGEVVIWELQAGGANVEIGDRVAVEGYMHRRGRNSVYVRSISVNDSPPRTTGFQAAADDGVRQGRGPVEDWKTFTEISAGYDNNYPFDITGDWNDRYRFRLTVDDLEPKPIPFTAEGRRIFEENQQFGKDPALRCINLGLARLFGSSTRSKIYDVGPYYLFLYSIAHNAYRTIHMDGRPAPDEHPLTMMGFSTGRWEDGSLIVETTHLKPMWLEGSGHPMSGAQTRLVETYTPSPDGSTMDRVMAIYDPLYAEPLFRARASARTDERPLGDNECDPDPFYNDLFNEGLLEDYLREKGYQ